MARISKVRVAQFFQRAGDAETTTEAGRALEDLVCYLFEKVPGITLSKRNELNEFHSEEIDVAFWNTQTGRGLYFLPSIILVECKHWSRPVGSEQVSWFDSKLRNRRAFPFGILVATDGITGNAKDKTAAHDIIRSALREGRQIVVITRSEIEQLTDGTHLINLIKEKLCELAVSGTLFL